MSGCTESEKTRVRGLRPAPLCTCYSSAGLQLTDTHTRTYARTHAHARMHSRSCAPARTHARTHTLAYPDPPTHTTTHTHTQARKEIIYLSLHCHDQNDSCFKMGSDASHCNVSLIVKDKVTRQRPRTTTFQEKGEPKRIPAEVLLFTSLTPYR